MLLSYKPLHSEAQQRLQGEGCVVDITVLLLDPDSSSEKDSEIDDQSYSPTEMCSLTWHGYTAHIMHMVSCISSTLLHRYLLSLLIK